jgi:hypothetical protein
VREIAKNMREGYQFVGQTQVLKWDVTFKTYPGGHSPVGKVELTEAVRWWLKSPAKGK